MTSEKSLTRQKTDAVDRVATALNNVASALDHVGIRISDAIKAETMAEDIRTSDPFRPIDARIVEVHYGRTPGGPSVCGKVPDDDLITDTQLRDVTCRECLMSLVDGLLTANGEATSALGEAQAHRTALADEVMRHRVKVQNLADENGRLRRELHHTQTENDAALYEVQRYAEEAIAGLERDLALIEADIDAMDPEALGRGGQEVAAPEAATPTPVPAGDIRHVPVGALIVGGVRRCAQCGYGYNDPQRHIAEPW